MSYMIQIENLLYEATNLYPRLMALRVDLHLPAIIDNGDSVCCFHNNSSGEISRFRNSLRSKIDADQNRKRQRGLRIYDSQAFIIWAKEYSQEGKAIIIFVYYSTKMPTIILETMSMKITCVV